MATRSAFARALSLARRHCWFYADMRLVHTATAFCRSTSPALALTRALPRHRLHHRRRRRARPSMHALLQHSTIAAGAHSTFRTIGASKICRPARLTRSSRCSGCGMVCGSWRPATTRRTPSHCTMMRTGSTRPAAKIGEGTAAHLKRSTLLVGTGSTSPHRHLSLETAPQAPPPQCSSASASSLEHQQRI